MAYTNIYGPRGVYSRVLNTFILTHDRIITRHDLTIRLIVPRSKYLLLDYYFLCKMNLDLVYTPFFEKVRRFPSFFTFLISIPMIFTHNIDSDKLHDSHIFPSFQNHDVLFQRFPLRPRACGSL
jgi:hypothetical protein